MTFLPKCLATLDFSDGSRAELRRLSVGLTYEGLMQGTPDSRFNQELIDGARQQAVRASPHVPVYVLAPPRRLGDTRREEWLPGVHCQGRFTGQDAGGRHGDLNIVWWQDDTDLPFSEEARRRLAAVEWSVLAEELYD
ncbi:hypothetical protein [Streptomyces fractus]|uniref:hypothetical protein n=1 Tax=Streptomyces fractus TaxID=641806 RepID=UPI003CFB3BEA